MREMENVWSEALTQVHGIPHEATISNCMFNPGARDLYIKHSACEERHTSFSVGRDLSTHPSDRALLAEGRPVHSSRVMPLVVPLKL